MPRAVTAYLCIFRCGRRATTHRKGMERHESMCLKNPERRACPTCKYDEWTAEDCDNPSPPREPHCAKGVRPEGKVCVVLCDGWEARRSP